MRVSIVPEIKRHVNEVLQENIGSFLTSDLLLCNVARAYKIEIVIA